MTERLNINLAGTTFSDETHTDVGSAAFELDHDWFTQEDLVIRTAAAGGGTLLALNTDYVLSGESVDDATKGVAGLSTRSAKTVYHYIQVTNASYQTGDLYFSGKYIGDSIDADDYNYLLSSLRPKGHLFGLTLANGTDATNDINVAAGEAMDSTGAQLMVYAGGTKQLDAAWAVGTAAGGRDTGAIADGTWHIWLIMRPDTGVVDVLFSTSASAPTMPTDYTLKRRIGSIIRASGTIVAFVQYGREFLLSSPVADHTAVNPGATATLYAMTVPTGIQVKARIRVVAEDTATAGASYYLYVSSPSQADLAAAADGRSLWAFHSSSYQFLGFSEYEIWTNTSGQIRARANSANLEASFATVGWEDDAGRSV